ncbi:sensor histidine kinase [Patescibacteria group bacterium]
MSNKIKKSEREKHIEKIKKEFISLAAHQLRTPLSAVKWILNALLEGEAGKLSKKQKEYIQQGYQNNERMISLINDLLCVAEVDEGRYVKDESYQEMEMIIENIIASFKKKIDKKNIKIIFNKPLAPSPNIKIDADKIKLVIRNMLDNAIRYNKRNGKVTVSVKYDKMNIEVAVKDTGVGVPKNEKDRIFEKFFRASNVIKLDTTGTGLGLFICKSIIEAHEGKIMFESKKGKGSIFKFELPIK